LDHWPIGQIATLHLITQIVHYLGNAGHADTANADKVDNANIRSNTTH
jgi:hypothetical protein